MLSTLFGYCVSCYGMSQCFDIFPVLGFPRNFASLHSSSLECNLLIPRSGVSCINNSPSYLFELEMLWLAY